jgi:hypothetical protein
MSSLLVIACEGRVISVGAKAMRPAVEEGNTFTVGIRLGRARYCMPRSGSMGSMIASCSCGELAKALFVSTVKIVFEGS